MKKKIKSYKIFKEEVKTLITFYKVNSSFLKRVKNDLSSDKDTIRNRSKEINKLLDFNHNDGRVGNEKFRGELIYTLRELIFVRLISALEVFLVDSVKEVFTHTTILFMDDNVQYEFKQSELLAYSSISELRSKIIKKQLRALSSGGFEDVISFYKKRFNIELGGIMPGKRKMIEYHELRHLLVHRLGKTDKIFREKFQHQEKQVLISEELLFNFINDLNSFCTCVKSELTSLIKKHPSDIKRKENREIDHVVIILKNSEETPYFVKPRFHFWHNEDLIFFSDLKSRIDYKDNEVRIDFWDDRSVLSSYLSNLRTIMSSKKKYRDIEIARSNLRKGKIKISDEIEDVLDSVRNVLPEQPWENGIHKFVAEKLNISNTVANKAINYLVHNGEYKNQIRGEIL